MKLCNLDTAKALQELGYDGEYNQYVSDDGSYLSRGSLSAYDWHIPCPRLDDAAYWIREKYGIFIDIRYARENIRKSSKRSWAYILKEMDSMAAQYGDSFYCSYELALSDAVTKAIEIIKNKNNE